MRDIKVKPTKIAILGANGFIGSHVVDLLAKDSSVNIKAIDRFSKHVMFNERKNIHHYPVDFFEDSSGFEEALDGVDYLIHCFSSTNPFISDQNPYLDIEMLRRSVEIFEKSIQKGVKKIVFISSGGAVYGNTKHDGDAHEEVMPAPMSPYGIAKLAIEHYLEYFKVKYGTDYVVYRLTNPYGPRQAMKKNQGVIPAFLDNILNDREVVIYGDGTASRDYIFIEDAAKMIVDTFMKDTEHTIYNVGSGRQTTLNEILDVLRVVLSKDIQVTYTDPPKTFLKNTNVDVKRFVDEFSIAANTELHQGIAKTIQAMN